MQKSQAHKACLCLIAATVGTFLAAVNAYSSGPTIGAASLVFPHFAQGGGYQTSFTFNNLSFMPATLTLEYLSTTGSTIQTTSLGLAGFGSVRTAMTGSMLTTGWVRATTNPAAEVTGIEVIQVLNSSGVPIGETSLLAAPADTFLRIPLFERDGFGTGVAIVNVGSSNTTVNMTVRSANGAIATTGSAPVGSAQQSAKMLFQLFPSISDFEGTMELTSPTPIAAIALRINLTSGTFSTSPISPTPTEAFFSPNAGTSAKIAQEINQAQKTVDIAIYSFTRDEIADALIAAKNRGVAIRILADSSQANGLGSEIARLESAGFQLKRTNGAGGGILHHKYAIIDGRLLVTGSYNWSTAAESSNDENAVFLRNAPVIAAFQSNFNSMWSTR